MRALAFALVAALMPLSGCMYFLCGPTEYAVTGITLYARFDEPWDPALAAAGIRAAGFEPRNATERTVDGRNETYWVESNGDANGSTLRISLRLDDAHGLDRDEADARADEEFDRHNATLRSIIAAFEQTSGWTREGEPGRDAGILHGDC